MGEFINLKKKPTKDEFEGLMKVLQDKRIYGESEQKKDYYVALKKFCEFNVKALGSEKDDLANLKEEYFDIVNIKRLKPFFIETYGK